MKRYRVASYYPTDVAAYHSTDYIIWGDEKQSWLKFSGFSQVFHFPDTPLERCMTGWDFDSENYEITEI